MTPPRLSPRPSLLGIFGHPDDESLLAGGVLAQHAASGAATAVVTATWAPDSHRAVELADALKVLGAERPRMLGFADARIPDSAPGQPRLCDAPLDEVVELLVGHIRTARPDVVVTHDAYGQLTGHPDHVRIHQVTVLAFHAAGLEHRYPQAGAPWQPRALYAATHPHSGIGELSPLLTRVGKKVLSVPDEFVTATVDVSAWCDHKWRAILAHQSEAARERPLPGLLARLPEETRRKIIQTEHFTRLTPGPVPDDPHRLTT
ncbi:PIG-L family deacetylase [Streptomyces sp. ISL-98]|uniref:PIG-L deacetylase family protein n=1 Tax=Streptomyces sp. ISL-98 TaxID=2819192 RepID=UPI001BE72B38|nr:PIG-L family deacetylase [Streptomyces sp. ISL-98]MBT2509264.1 PIG-L family deacetylase [Streptomyces sp. ISL-98]